MGRRAINLQPVTCTIQPPNTMHEFKDDKEFQARLLANHPAYRANGVDPLWRWIAAMGWITVAILVATIAARGQEVKGGRLKVTGFGISPGSKAVATNGSLGSGFSSGSTKQRTTPEPAGPGLLTVTGERLKVTGSRAANVAPNLQPATYHLQPHTRTSLITERFLDALEDVESGRDARAVGDHGRSLGSYQFKAVAWRQVNALQSYREQVAGDRLERANLKPETLNLQRAIYPYSFATNRVIARLYARSYLRWLESYLTRALRRSPTYPELYAVWNLGPAGFRARGFDLARCPEHVRKAAGRMEPAKHANNAKGGGK